MNNNMLFDSEDFPENIQKFFDDNFANIGLSTENGIIVFPAEQVANILEYPNPKAAINKYCKGDGYIIYEHPDGKNVTFRIRAIGIDDVIRLLRRSKRQEAKEFSDWFANTYLPEEFGSQTEEILEFLS